VTLINDILLNCNNNLKQEQEEKNPKIPDSVIQKNNSNEISILREKIDELQVNDIKYAAKVTP